jgi:hypothetical protein
MTSFIGCVQKFTSGKHHTGVTYLLITDDSPLFQKEGEDKRICIMLRQKGLKGIIHCAFCSEDLNTLLTSAEYSRIPLGKLPLEVQSAVFSILSREVL